jgi:pseudaminic acid synthase
MIKSKTIQIDDRIIGNGNPVYIIAEMSGNHSKEYKNALRIIDAAKEAGADAIKIQTYTPDTITIQSDKKYFKINGTIWDGKTLYDLFEEAYTPWEWQPNLKEHADKIGIHLFSSPFDFTAVEHLEKMKVPAYKIASPEIIDLPLIEKISSTNKPVIMSTGMATLAEIEEAVQTFYSAKGKYIALLKCTSMYPAPYDGMNLKSIPVISDCFGVPVGLSDHSLGNEVAISAVALGACIIEKHLTINRSEHGPDSAFSMEPDEFRTMVEAIRNTELALGDGIYKVNKNEFKNRDLRRSLFAVRDIKQGETFTNENIRSIRPGRGLHTRYFYRIIGKKANIDISKATPLSWDLIE